MCQLVYAVVGDITTVQNTCHHTSDGIALRDPFYILGTTCNMCQLVYVVIGDATTKKCHHVSEDMGTSRRPCNQRDPAVLHDSSRDKPARVFKRHMLEPQAVQDAQTSCRLLCGHSPSAISWRGSISRCFSNTSTPVPLDAPGGKTSSMSGRAWLINENKMRSGSCRESRDRLCFTALFCIFVAPSRPKEKLLIIRYRINISSFGVKQSGC